MSEQAALACRPVVRADDVRDQLDLEPDAVDDDKPAEVNRTARTSCRSWSRAPPRFVRSTRRAD